MTENNIQRIMFYDEDLKEWVVDSIGIEEIKQNETSLEEKNNQEPLPSFSQAIL